MMQATCTDFTFHALPYEKALRLIKELEFDNVEIIFFPGCRHIDSEQIRTDPAKAARDAKRLIDDAGLKVSGAIGLFGGYDQLALADPDPKVRDEARHAFLQQIEFTTALEAPNISVMLGVPVGDQSKESAIAHAGEELAWRAEQAIAAGLTCSFEAHSESFAKTVADVVELLRIAPEMRLALDYRHLVYNGNTQDEIEERLHGATSHLHGSQAAPGNMQTTLRQGTIDFERILRSFANDGYDGYFVVEYCSDPYMDMDQVDTISETIKLRDLFYHVRDGVPLPVEEDYPWE